MADYVRRNHLALIALFFAVAGIPAAYAIGKNTIGSKQLKPAAVRTSDLADNSVTSPKVANGSLLGEDFAPGQLQRGATGPAGPQGTTGPQGPANPSAETLDGLDSTDFLRSNAQFGGDVSGSSSALEIGANKVGTAEVANDSLGKSDIAEEALGLAAGRTVYAETEGPGSGFTHNVPDRYQLSVSCPAAPGAAPTITFTNLSGVAMNLFVENVSANTVAYQQLTDSGGGSVNSISGATGTAPSATRVVYGYEYADGDGLHFGKVILDRVDRGSDCHAQVQAFLSD